MHAKPILLASMVCAGLLGAGCGDRASNDTMAQRADRATQPAAPPASTPPVISPGERAADAVGDTALTAKVKTALVAEPGLKSTSIDVTTKDAVVTLSGTVESPTERAKARQVAENIQGVRSVVDKLTAKS